MDIISFHDLNDSQKELMLESALGNEGKIISRTNGMCGDIYIFDRGENTIPQYSCAKLPKLLSSGSEKEIYVRFVNELKNQLKYYHHQYVHWAYDFKEVMGVPVALFRYWGSDLKKLINEPSVSDLNKLSVMTYLCVGLRHCYSKGLVSHQDLKPENIFIRNVRKDFTGLPDTDVFNFPLVGDFGLANAFLDSSLFDGSRPYMAPEQWGKNPLSSKTDVFALGVILFQLMSGGFHPIGIKLNDYWPVPIEGNSKKWTRPEPWMKWAINGAAIDNNLKELIDSSILQLINKMLSLSPNERPEISEVIENLLDLIKSRDPNGFGQVNFLISHYDAKVSTESFETLWPSLFHRWQKFEEKFG